MSREQFGTLLEAAPDATVITDGTGTIVLANAQAEKLFGYLRDELIGEPVEVLIPARLRAAHGTHRMHHFASPRASAMCASLELLGLRKDGGEFPVEISLSPVQIGDETLVISAIRDVTAHRAALKEAREANRIKDEFLATLSHELRTPLTAIMGWSAMLAGGSLAPSTLPKVAQSISTSARHLATLVDDLLDVSRIVTGSLRLDLESVQLKLVIEDAIEIVKATATAKNIRLEAALDESGLVVAGDSARLRQVVWNLLSNAVKFTPNGGHVRVALEHEGSEAQVVVSDTGRGIHAEFLPFVFDRFRQADSTATRAMTGLGLGLAIARHVVELHGGSVRAESAGENMGATFTVRLPIQASVHDRRKSPAIATLSYAGVHPDSDVPNLALIRALVVDDDYETQELVSAVLRRAGADARTASSAEEAWAVLDDYRPDVIVCDIAMPDEDGHALIRKIRSRGSAEGGRTPAIALSAYARAEDRRRSLLAGFQSHLAKPAEPSELLALVATLVGRTGSTEVELA